MTEIWVTDINSIGFIPRRLFELLDKTEQDRAAKISSLLDRRLYVLSRILLRLALSSVLPKEPSQWRFSLSKEGKPVLAAPHASDMIDFNLSHSGHAVAVSICHSNTQPSQVGIDIELMDQKAFRGSGVLLKSFFTLQELKFLKSRERGRRWEETLRLWTIKEAYAKYLGLGFGLDFSRLVIPHALPGLTFATYDLGIGNERYHLALTSSTDTTDREIMKKPLVRQILL